MDDNTRREIAKQAIQLVEEFFNSRGKDEKKNLPEILRNPGRWTANFTGFVLGIFFLSKRELQRVVSNQNKGVPPFPGFLISEDLKPLGEATAILMGGSLNYFASNRTVNLWAFTVKPGASFTVVDHFHEVKDLSTGQEFQFRVDLAFVLGLHQKEQWSDVKPRLSELLSYTMKAWKKI